MTNLHIWQSVEIGYQANSTNPAICKPGAPKPDALVALEKTFPALIRKEMIDGGTIPWATANEGDDDLWVPGALTKLLNQFLAKAGVKDRVVIDPVADFARLLLPEEACLVGTMSAESNPPAKGVDTRCILRGEKWYSIRTYRICRAVAPSDPWFPAPKPGVPDISSSVDYLTATLTWLCQSVDN